MTETIHVTNKEQLQSCFDIRMKVFVEEQQVPKHLEMDEKDESHEASHHFLLLEGGQAAATARWYMYAEGIAKLQRIAVLAEHRGKGLGKELVLAIEEHAKELGCVSAMLDAQCQAEGFYASLGYHVISPEPFDDAGIPHVSMQKPL